MASVALRISRAPPTISLSRSSFSSPAWYMPRRCLTASDSISDLGNATVSSGIGMERLRSGENRSLSEASVAPRARFTCRYAGASIIGLSVSPNISVSRYDDSAIVALRVAAIRCGALDRASGSLSSVPTSFSISSLKRVAAPSPTIDSAPVTWCRWVATYFAVLVSPGSIASLSRCERASVSECSISAFTQERGPISNVEEGLAAIYFAVRERVRVVTDWGVTAGR